jgi:hypothetical protein
VLTRKLVSEKIMLRMLKTLSLTSVLAALGLFAASCGTDHAQVRLVHASPDAPNVDVAVDGKTVVTDLAFGSSSPGSGYLTVTAGNRRVEVRTTGTTTDLINSTVSFGSGKAYTVIASGLLADIAAVVLTDDHSAPQSGNIKLRVVHASTSVPPLPSTSVPGPLDVYVVAPGTDIAGMSPTIPSLAYQQASGYQSLPGGSYEVIVTPAGDQTQQPIDQTYTLAAGQIRTLVILDVAGGGTVSATPLELADLN